MLTTSDDRISPTPSDEEKRISIDANSQFYSCDGINSHSDGKTYAVLTKSDGKLAIISTTPNVATSTYSTQESIFAQTEFVQGTSDSYPIQIYFKSDQ